MAWICGKHLGVTIADGQGCVSCNPPYTIKDANGNNIQLQNGSKGAATKTLFTVGTPEYTAWDNACKAATPDPVLIKQLEDAARAK